MCSLQPPFFFLPVGTISSDAFAKACARSCEVKHIHLAQISL